MITAIAFGLLGAWNYAGFADESAPSRPPAPQPPPPAATATEPAGPPLLPRDPAPPVAPLVRQVAPMPPAVLYRLVDGCGQTWEHTDPAYLAAWVNARNQSGASCRRTATGRFRP